MGTHPSTSQSAIASTESAIEGLFGTNPDVSASGDILDAAPNVDLNLSIPSNPVFNFFVSSRDQDTVAVSGAAAISEDITFLDNQGTAIINNPTNYAGVIFGFVAGDTIDLAGVSATAATLGSGNALVVQTDSGSLTLKLDPTQSFVGDEFDTVPDGSGGTNITFVTPPVTTVPASLTVTANQIASIGNGFSIADSDVNASGKTFTVVLSDANGSLSASQVTGGSVSGSGSSTLTLTGGLEAINSELASLTDLEAVVVPLGGTGAPASSSDLIQVTTSDGNGGGDVHQVDVTVNNSTTGGGSGGGGGIIHVPKNGTLNLDKNGGNFTVESDGGVLEIVVPYQTSVPGGGYLVSIVSGAQNIQGQEAELTLKETFMPVGAGTTVVENLSDILLPQEYFIGSDITSDFELSSGPIITVLPSRVTLIPQIGTVTYAFESYPTSVACFVRGTRILTAHGEVAVEDLRIGDQLATASGEVKPIKWIGRRSYADRFFAGNPKVQPIRIRAYALGADLPRRDLLISPEHAMFLDGFLVPARHLVNGISIVRERNLERVDYFHIELDNHHVIYAEGARSCVTLRA